MRQRTRLASVMRTTPDKYDALANTPDKYDALANTPDKNDALANTPDKYDALANTPDKNDALANTPDKNDALANTVCRLCYRLGLCCRLLSFSITCKCPPNFFLLCFPGTIQLWSDISYRTYSVIFRYCILTAATNLNCNYLWCFVLLFTFCYWTLLVIGRQRRQVSLSGSGGVGYVAQRKTAWVGLLLSPRLVQKWTHFFYVSN